MNSSDEPQVEASTESCFDSECMRKPQIDCDFLLTHTPLRMVRYIEETDSTNDLARRFAANGELALPAMVIADRQARGRGRGNRGWWSSVGSLTCSIVLSDQQTPLPALVSLGTALAVVDSIREYDQSLQPKIKWPNDVMIAGRKVAGILIESMALGSSERSLGARLDMMDDLPDHFAPCDSPRRVQIIGVGVNTNCRMDDAPLSLQQTSCSLTQILSKPVDQTRFVATVVNRLLENTTNSQGSLESLKSRCLQAAWVVPGVRIVVQKPDGEVHAGSFHGFGCHGELVLCAGLSHIVIFSGTIKSVGT